MSIEKAKKLEDLKARAEAIRNQRFEIVKPQLPVAVKAALQQMADYLQSQSFTITYNQTSPRGFKAQYKGIDVVVSSTSDDDNLIGADYEIHLKTGKNQLSVRLMVNRGQSVSGPVSGDIDTVIHDYESRYIPLLEGLSASDLDGSYTLFSYATNKSGTRTVYFSNGKEVIDKLFETI